MLPPLLMSRNGFHYRFALHYFAFVDPDFDADDAVDRMSFGETVVDVRPECRKRQLSFKIPFRASDLSSAETACALLCAVRVVSSITPRTSAASRPRALARSAIACAVVRSAATSAAGSGAGTAAGAPLSCRLNTLSMTTSEVRGPDRYQYSRSFTRRRAIDWLCSWQTRDSVTLSTAAISFRFMSCS